MLLADWADRLSVVAIVVVPIHVVRIEVHVVGVVRIVRIERTRPVVAVRTSIVEVTIVHVTRSGQLFLRRWYCFFRGRGNALLQANYPILLLSLLNRRADHL